MNTVTETPPAIAMDAVESSNIHSIGYDASLRIMAVRFKSFPTKEKEAEPTALYHYEHVDPVEHARVIAGDIGAGITKTFNALIKANPARHPYTKIESAPGVPVIQIGATDVS